MYRFLPEMWYIRQLGRNSKFYSVLNAARFYGAGEFTDVRAINYFRSLPALGELRSKRILRNYNA